MLEQDLYRGVSEFLADWARDQDAAFELFHVIGGPADRPSYELRKLLTRFSVPYRYHLADSDDGPPPAGRATGWTDRGCR